MKQNKKMKAIVKKGTILCIAGAMALSITACGGGRRATSQNNKPGITQSVGKDAEDKKAGNLGANRKPETGNDQKQPETGANRKPETGANRKPETGNDQKQPETGADRKPETGNDQKQPETGIDKEQNIEGKEKEEKKDDKSASGKRDKKDKKSTAKDTAGTRLADKKGATGKKNG